MVERIGVLIRQSDALLDWSDNSTGPAIVFAKAPGTDMRQWVARLPHLPDGLRILRFHVPGKGLSDHDPDVPISSVSDDVAALLDHLALPPASIVGLSMGGLIAQKLAATPPDLVGALVISNTAARIGTPSCCAAVAGPHAFKDHWADRRPQSH